MKGFFKAAALVSGLLVAMIFCVSQVLAGESPAEKPVGPVASSAQTIKIGYVDFIRVRAESKAGINAQKADEAMIKDKQAQLLKMQDDYTKLMAEAEKLNNERQSSLLSAKAIKEKEDALRQKQDKLAKDGKEMQRFKADAEEEIEKKRNEIYKQFSEDLVNIINKFGKEEGYTLILDHAVVLYAPEAVDVTDRIIKAFNDMKG